MSSIIRSNQASGAYPRLAFDEFDGPPREHAPEPAAAPQPPAAAPPPANETIELAPGFTLPTMEELEQIRADAQRDGYAQGYEEGSARGRLEAAELHQVLQGFEAALGSFDTAVAEELQALAIELARQIVRDTLAIRPEAVLAVAREALAALPQQAAVVRVHPDDAQLMRQYLAEHFDTLGHRVSEDASVMRGGCSIECAGAQIDAELPTRWRRVLESISPEAAEAGPE